MAACEGFATHLDEYVNKLYEDKQSWNTFINLLIKHSNNITLLGNTEHFIWIGYKQP
ncbi:MAG: hypothetical protein NDF54_10355 [archaeon GB-1867-035]|nr:hypothetical protein [Candidatus Culexmicrobium profundum]